MANDLNRSIKIYIDNSDAMKKASELTAKIGTLEKALFDLDTQGKKDTPEYTRKAKALKDLHGVYARYEQKVKDVERVLKNLSGATKTELLMAQKEVRKSMKDVERGTDEYNAKLKTLLAVKAELAVANQEERLEMGKQATMWDRAANGFNKYFGIATAFIAAITGVSFTLRKLAQDNAALDDVYSDVMKTTGNTRDEVLSLNETFKAMDTRTSREQLNLLARDAGKLGLSAREDLLNFVEAGNQINVALGEDLGEGAIKNIGKMTDVYARSTKEMDRLDLKGKMLAVGSAINELGQSSTASEPYMVSFTQRLGGVASQAGISIQNVLGFASALDQSGQAVEMSATALQKFIMSVMGEPAKFAKIAGEDVKEFTKLLETDANEAIKKVLTSLSQKGGFQQLIPIFKEMGLDGARAVGVLSALATNIDKVDEAQRISNEAFAEGTSITEEYSIKNNNLQAQLEKSRKAFNDAALELGERLSPALLQSTKWTTYFIKLLPVLLDFLEKYWKYILIVASGYGVFILQMKLATLQLQLQAKWFAITRTAGIAYSGFIALLTGNVTRATAAWRMLNIAIKANPWGIAITLITSAALAIYHFGKETEKVNKLLEVQNKISEKANDQYIEQESHVRVLIRTLNNEAASLTNRKKALNELKEIIPGYHADLTEEGKLINNNKEAIDQYLVSYKKRLKLDATSDELKELYKQEQKLSKDYYAAADKARSVTRGDATMAEHLGFSNYKKNREKERDVIKDEWDETVRMIKGLEKDVDNAQKDLRNSAVGDDEDVTPTGGGSGGETKASEQKKKLNLALEAIETTHQNRLSDIKKQYRDGDIKTESEYNQKIFSQEQAYYILRDELLTNFLKRVSDKELRSDIEKQIATQQQKRLDDELRYRKRIEQILLDANPEEKERIAYENRLRDAGLFNVDREKLSAENLQALELLEKQHQDNIDKIRKQGAAMAKADAETKFKESFASEKERLQEELNVLMADAATLSSHTFEAEMLIHQKRLEIIRAEMKARSEAGLETTKQQKEQGKEEANMTSTVRKEVERRSALYAKHGTDIGNTLGMVMTGQVDALEGFKDVTLDIMFDLLAEIIQSELTNVMATSTSAIMRATAEAMATPGSALTFGAKGFATAAILTGAIMAATTAAKAALKGMLGKRGGSSSNSSSSGGTSSSGNMTIKQRARGNYSVIGEEDGRTYNNVPFTGMAQTGIVATPTLVGETGNELIVSAPDLQSLQRHMNYPIIVQALNDVRSGAVPQRAQGNYSAVENTNNVPSSANSDSVLQELTKALKEFVDKDMTPMFPITEIQGKIEKLEKQKKRFSQPQSGSKN